MREIKFRAWNGKEMEPLYISPNAPYKISFEDYLGYVLDIGIEVMQYTGFKDMDGKEIYEGDIIEVDNGDGGIYTRCIWEPGRCVLEDKAGGQWTRQLYNYPVRLKIIGNIYENPDLL